MKQKKNIWEFLAYKWTAPLRLEGRFVICGIGSRIRVILMRIRFSEKYFNV